MKRSCLWMLLLAGAFGVVPSVHADSASVGDPAEGYAIDVTSATHRHPAFAPGAVVVHVVRTAGEWSSADLPRAVVRLRLVGADKPRSRLVSLVPAPDGSLRASISDGSGSRLFGHAFAWRPDGQTLRIEMARSLLGGARAYRWSAMVYQPCPEGQTCSLSWDRVPDTGSVLHQLK